MEKARCLSYDSGLEIMLWGEALRTATYLCNRKETSALTDKMVPAALWYGYTEIFNKIKLFDCVVDIHIPKDRKSKLDSRSQKLLMIGYTNSGYILWDPENRKVVARRNVVFIEDKEQS